MAEKIDAFYFVDATAEALAHRTARYMVDRVVEAVGARGRGRIAISGGNTPKRTFELLAESPYREQMPWEKLDLYWVDERAVPPGDADSNYRMTREALLDKVPLREEQIFRIHGELDPEKAAVEYEFDIRRSFRLEGAQMPVFDSVSLGMGPDGHQARDVFFLIAGADKAAPLSGVLTGAYNPHQLPAQLIRPESGRLTLLLDRAAASLLPQPDADGVGKLEIAR
jgi:6-phosphogluconolactonase